MCIGHKYSSFQKKKKFGRQKQNFFNADADADDDADADAGEKNLIKNYTT